MTKLKFYLNKDGQKIYTLKAKVNKKPTKDAHYKYLKLKDTTNSN